ncbi:BolA/IbaG family iron-sulfur metabolism protein [Bombella sp. ESL0378]|uniref:BolA family protein n=1 Tax=unclassified Bombella TaxID=2644098 RepID=UPI0012D99199|nr:MULTISPECIES: BolA family transcriptional regulator [unclassified Bombella]MUG04603.1 BolA/IbaG family iron-sulfur metabolism protein [Bombella sp. ESL0378]MUG90097.1 BolA/IbaG family iron-sulfur metabolism protein [Bombella sp. ESL0385]
MTVNEIEKALRAAFPNAEIVVEDLAGDGNHFACEVVSDVFRGLTRVKQHKLVYDAFGDRVGTELHALAVKTRAPE